MRIDRTGVLIGLFYVAAGVLFLLEGLDVVDVRGAYLWPLLLIGFGIALLAGSLRRGPEAAPARPRTEELRRDEGGTTELPREEPPVTEKHPRERPPEDA